MDLTQSHVEARIREVFAGEDPESDALHEELETLTFNDPTSPEASEAVKAIWEMANRKYDAWTDGAGNQHDGGTLFDLWMDYARDEYPDDTDDQVMYVTDQMEELGWGAGLWENLTDDDIADISGTIEAHIEEIAGL